MHLNVLVPLLVILLRATNAQNFPYYRAPPLPKAPAEIIREAESEINALVRTGHLSVNIIKLIDLKLENIIRDVLYLRDQEPALKRKIVLLQVTQETIVNAKRIQTQFTNERVQNLQRESQALRHQLSVLEAKEQQSSIEIQTLKDAITEVASSFNAINKNSYVAPAKFAHDCEELLEQGYTLDGVYGIFVSNQTVRVWCDMQNGGWIVLQKRFDGSLNFSRRFTEYSEGFGDLHGEHWLGLKYVHQLTITGNWTLHFDLETSNNTKGWTEYRNFHIEAYPGYALYFDQSNYRGNAGDKLQLNYGMNFTASDRDQDTWESGNCAEWYGGAWWYHNCIGTVTTGMPYNQLYSIYWDTWTPCEFTKAITMKIKRI